MIFHFRPGMAGQEVSFLHLSVCVRRRALAKSPSYQIMRLPTNEFKRNQIRRLSFDLPEKLETKLLEKLLTETLNQTTSFEMGRKHRFFLPSR